MEHLFETVKTSVELRHLGKSTSGVSREYTRGELFKIGHNEVPQVLFRLSRWENLEHAEEV